VPQRPFQRGNPDGFRLQFGGINTVNPPDAMPPGKYPYAQNVRNYVRQRVGPRAAQDTPVETLPSSVHSLRRLNDSTPPGQALGGFTLVAGAGSELYVGGNPVLTPGSPPLSGNPLAILPFRPNASVQPWAYVADSAEMVKTQIDQTLYKWGIEEPQQAPLVIPDIVSDQVSLVGPVTVTYWGDSPHSGPVGNYIWRNPSDTGGSGPERTFPANGVTTGNSLIFDYPPIVNPPNEFGTPHQPMQWTQYTVYSGQVTVNNGPPLGSATQAYIQWSSGTQFDGLVAGDIIIIQGVSYVISATPTAPTGNSLWLTQLVIAFGTGTFNDVDYSAAILGTAKAVFEPAMEPAGYSDFNMVVTGTFYIPAAGTHTFTLNSKDECNWGIGASGTGNATWPAPTGSEQLSSSGQTLTAINGYPLMPKLIDLTAQPGGGGQVDTGSVAVTFSQAGNYPFELNFDYWARFSFAVTPPVVRHLLIQADNNDIPPLPETVITNSQYRYTYRSSATGAVSNPSPESPQTPTSVLANFIVPFGTTDPQVDKIDIYRMDSGLENFTYVGTVPTAPTFNGTLGIAVSPGSQVFTINVTPGPIPPFASPAIGAVWFAVNEEIVVDGESVAITLVTGAPGSQLLTATFVNAHAAGSAVQGNGRFAAGADSFTDELLDVDVAANPLLEFDNYEPFPVTDLPHNGVVDVAPGGLLQYVSGDPFNVRWLPGTVVVVGQIAFTLVNRPQQDIMNVANVDLVGGVEAQVFPNTGTNVSYSIQEPIMASQNLPFVWGPSDNIGFMFGCGDPINPGILYWTKGNAPDAAPQTNQMNVTSPSEPLMNGCIVNGQGMVFSTERAFGILPNFFNAQATVEGTVGSTWTVQENISNRGLFMPWCLAVDGGGTVFFRAKDGIYESTG
jgi:hypothetical protein